MSICKLRLLDIFTFVKSICSRFAQTRYDINLVAKGNISSASAHIESFMTYRKSRQRFISLKKRQISLSKSVFFSGAAGRGRTDTVSLPQDFESSASANSTTAAYEIEYLKRIPYSPLSVNTFFEFNCLEKTDI